MDPILVIYLLLVMLVLLSEKYPFLETLTGLSTVRAYREQASRCHLRAILISNFFNLPRDTRIDALKMQNEDSTWKIGLT